MDSLITILSKLQDVCSTIGSTQKINLPQIIVVGSQSSGKSSVLESLVGKSFLPRGTGIVTRAPLVLHLLNPSEFKGEMIEPKKSKEWATFLHKPNVVFHDFDKVRKEIESRTEELAGDMKNISDKPIVLNVYSKRMYNLSFVDLPGLTKLPVGEQHPDIVIKIRNLVLKFIENPNSIILAVVTANTDPATSESLHIAKTVDPTGDRTIAVVTKIDIMDAGTDATELLSGEVIPVKLGIIGVINRSQKDINEQKSIKQSLEAEEKFFQKMYPAIAHQQGTSFLAKTLHNQLIEKIKPTFPKLKKQLFEMNTVYSQQLKSYNDFFNDIDRSLLDLITRITTNYVTCLDGQKKDISQTKLDEGAEIANYFKFVFSKEIDEIDPLYGLSEDSIANLIKNASGSTMGLFMPDKVFDQIVKKQLHQLLEPSLNCVSFVHEKLMSTIFNLDTDISLEMRKYPKLMEMVVESLQTWLNTCKQKSKKAVIKMINYQEAYINTHHPDFINAIIQSNEGKDLCMSSGYDANNQHINIFSIETLRKNVERITTCTLRSFSDTDKYILYSRVHLLYLFVNCYFKVVKLMVHDIIPKIIMHEMVNNIKQNFQKDLISKVYRSGDINMGELLLETEESKNERLKTQNSFDATDKALNLMNEIEKLCNESS